MPYPLSPLSACIRIWFRLIFPTNDPIHTVACALSNHYTDRHMLSHWLLAWCCFLSTANIGWKIPISFHIKGVFVLERICILKLPFSSKNRSSKWNLNISLYLLSSFFHSFAAICSVCNVQTDKWTLLQITTNCFVTVIRTAFVDKQNSDFFFARIPFFLPFFLWMATKFTTTHTPSHEFQVNKYGVCNDYISFLVLFVFFLLLLLSIFNFCALSPHSIALQFCVPFE